jgi:hypothetical protein
VQQRPGSVVIRNQNQKKSNGRELDNQRKIMKINLKTITIITGLTGFLIGNTTHAQNLVLNPGFETAGANSSLAADWTVDTAAGGPVYGIRTNDNPHSGSFNFEVLLASTGAGPVVEFNQSAIPVTASDVYTLSFYADRLAGSAGDVEQYNLQWFNVGNGLISQTSYQGFSPGANVYAQTVVNGLTAPSGAATATIYFHYAGAAAPSLSATIDMDDVSLSTVSVPEPMTISLAAMGMFGVWAFRRRRNV